MNSLKNVAGSVNPKTGSPDIRGCILTGTGFKDITGDGIDEIVGNTINQDLIVTGLTNDDVSLADTIIEVPLNPSFKSLNLSQAVLLVAYEWFQLTVEGPPERLEYGDTEIADKASLQNFLTRLENGLTEAGFFKSPDMKPIMIRNIHNIFQRVALTEQEVRTMHGIVETLKKWKEPS